MGEDDHLKGGDKRKGVSLKNSSGGKVGVVEEKSEQRRLKLPRHSLNGAEPELGPGLGK